MRILAEAADDWTHHDYVVRLGLLLLASALAYGIWLFAYRMFHKR